MIWESSGKSLSHAVSTSTLRQWSKCYWSRSDFSQMMMFPHVLTELKYMSVFQQKRPGICYYWPIIQITEDVGPIQDQGGDLGKNLGYCWKTEAWHLELIACVLYYKLWVWSQIQGNQNLEIDFIFRLVENSRSPSLTEANTEDTVSTQSRVNAANLKRELTVIERATSSVATWGFRAGVGNLLSSEGRIVPFLRSWGPLDQKSI